MNSFTTCKDRKWWINYLKEYLQPHGIPNLSYVEHKRRCFKECFRCFCQMKVCVLQNIIWPHWLSFIIYGLFFCVLLKIESHTALEGYEGHHQIVTMHYWSKTMTAKSSKDGAPVWGTWLLPHPGMRRLRSPQPGCEYGPWVLTYQQAAQTSSLPGPSPLNLAETPPPPAQDPAHFQRLCFLLPVRPLVPNHPVKDSRYGKVHNVVSWNQVSENRLLL